VYNLISRDVDGNEGGDAQTESVSVCINGDGYAVKSGFSILAGTVPTGVLLGKTF